MTNMPDDYEKRVEELLNDYFREVVDKAIEQRGENIYEFAERSKVIRTKFSERLAALIREADRNGERRGRIDELKHIDDPVNVNSYFEGLVPVRDRLKKLQADSVEKEQTDG